MGGQLGRPGALDDVLGAAASGHNLVGQLAALGQDEQVERVVEVVVVDGRIVGRVGRRQRHGPLGPRREQLGDQREGGLIEEWHTIVHVGRTGEALRAEELHVGLFGRLAHRVVSRRTRGGVPDGRLGQAVVESGKRKRSERKCGKIAAFFGFPLLVRCGRSPFGIDQVVRREPRLLGFVTEEDNLLQVRHTHTRQLSGFNG